jgi:hypothetical protein
MRNIKTEKQWQAESDARTLAEAERIKSETSRFKSAQMAAKKMVSDQQKDLQSLSKVAQSTPSNSKEPIKLSTPIKGVKK